MKSILVKVDDKIKSELDIIRQEEGLGNQTATVIYLIKYYFLTKKSKLDTTIELFDKVLDKINADKLPSLKDQLKSLKDE